LNCTLAVICPNITRNSTFQERLDCGAKLGSSLLNGFATNYPVLILPCNNITATPNNTGLNTGTEAFTSYVQKHSLLKKLPAARYAFIQSQQNNTSTSSGYVNTTALTPAQQAEFNSAQNTSSNQGNFTLNVDGSTPAAANNNTNADISTINSQANLTTTNQSQSNSNVLRFSLILIGIVISIILI